MDPLFQTFGEQVRRMRLARRLTQDALAERAELTPKYVSEIENGHVNPSLKVIHAIAVDGLGVSVAELFAGPLALSPARPVVAKLVASLQSEPDDVCQVVVRVVDALLGPSPLDRPKPRGRS
jgi:transcriptional regulator with XRE-family HTH domain